MKDNKDKKVKNLSEKKKWIIRKNGINTPFDALLYRNEFQITKQRIWHEIKNEEK